MAPCLGKVKEVAMAASMVSAQESESRRKIHICIHTRGRGQGRHGCCCSATVVATLFERYGCCYSLLNLGPFQRIALRGQLAAAAPFLSFSSTNLLSRGRHCAQEHHHHHCHDLLLWVNNHKDICNVPASLSSSMAASRRPSSVLPG